MQELEKLINENRAEIEFWIEKTKEKRAKVKALCDEMIVNLEAILLRPDSIEEYLWEYEQKAEEISTKYEAVLNEDQREELENQISNCSYYAEDILGLKEWIRDLLKRLD